MLRRTGGTVAISGLCLISGTARLYPLWAPTAGTHGTSAFPTGRVGVERVKSSPIARVRRLAGAFGWEKLRLRFGLL